MNRKHVFAILIGIVILGSFLRFYKLGEVSFVADEFLDINSSYAYFKTGVWQNWDFNRGEVNVENEFAPRDERAWIYKWQVAQLFRFFPPTEGVARSVSAIWGILTICIMLFVARDFTKKNEIGLLSAFLFAVSISGIIFDRRLRMYAMFFPVFLLLSWAVYKFLESDYKGRIAFVKKWSEKTGLNLIFGILILILAAISFNIHQLSGSIAAIVGAYILIRLFLTYKKSVAIRNKYAILAGLGSVGAVATWLIKPAVVDSFLAGLVFFENHWNYFTIAFNDYSLIVAAGLTLAAGIYYLAKTEKLPKEALWLSLSFFVPLLMAAFLWRRNVGEQYLFFAKSFLIILIASGIYAVADFIRKNIAKNSCRHYLAVIILFVILLPNYAYFFQENNAYRQTSRSENPNYRSVFVYFKKHRQSDSVLITRNFRNYYWSGEKVKTFDFGGELSRENFTLADLQRIMSENASGWFIYSRNDEDYIAKDAQKFAENNLEKVNAVAVRGDINVYKWGGSRP